MATDLTPVSAPPQFNDPSAVAYDPTPPDSAVSLPVFGVNSSPLPPAIAKQRTDKTVAGLGDSLTQDPAAMYEQFLNGQEDYVRRQAATALDYKNHMAKQQAIQDLAVKNGGPLDPDQVQKILDPFAPTNQPVDPDTVIERAYSNDYVSSAVKTAVDYMSDNNPITTGQQDQPQQTNNALADGSELLTKNQYILKWKQDMENLVQNQSTAGYLFDQGKQMFQPYTEFEERGALQGSSVLSGLGLSSNIDQQHYDLYKMPLPEFKQKFDAVMSNLQSNPSLAADYADRMLSQNSNDTVVGNLFTAMALPDAKAGFSLAKKVLTFNQVRKASADIIKSAMNDPSAGAVTKLEGAGVVTEAAVKKVSGEVTAAIEGAPIDPTQVAHGTLLSTWQTMADEFAANPGTYLSRESYTRLHDGIAKPGEDILNRIDLMARVERVPVAVSSEDVIRAYKDKIRSDFKGPPGMLADTEGPFVEPATRTYWYKQKLVDYNGEQFSDSATAVGRAEQIGLSNPIVEGTEAEKVYLPEAAVYRNEYTDFVSEARDSNGKSRNTYQPGSTVKKFRDDFEITSKEGRTQFFRHDPNVVGDRVEITPSSKPEPGLVPYNLKTQHFEPTLNLETARVEQQGVGFHIVSWVPMKESDSVIRDLMVKTTGGENIPEATSTSSATGIDNIKNSLLGWVRNSEDTLSINESAQRKAATYAKSNVEQWAQQLTKPFEELKRRYSKPTDWFGSKLSKKDTLQQFTRVLDDSRRMPDPATGEAGYFMKSPGELQQYYNTNFNRNPTELETEAYFNYVKIKEGERMFSEIAEFRNRAKEGYNQHQINLTQDGETVSSGFFDARKTERFPGGDDFIYIAGDSVGGGEVKKLGTINTTRLEELKRQWKTGEAKVLELYSVDHHPLQGFDGLEDQHIRYVFSNNSEEKPLTFNHVNKRGGAHYDWDYDHWIKQEDVRPQRVSEGKFENLYVGDKTIMPIKNRALGNKVAKIWNEAHAFIKTGDWDSARPLVAKLGIDWKEFTSWYHPGRDANGKPVRAMLDANAPITVVTKDRKIKDIDSSLEKRYVNFTDKTNTGSLNNWKVAYNTERRTDGDIRTINDIGTKDKPIFAHQPAEFVDPIATMNRSLNRSINSLFMDDYKSYGVEHWLREAEPYLKASQEEVRSAPFSHFNNPEFRTDVDFAKKQNLLSNNYKIRSFIGIPSSFDAWVHNFTEYLADTAYNKFGPEAGRTFSQKARSIPPIWMLHRLTNPVDFIRGATFNFKLGIFNPAQFLVQAQTHSLIWAMEPRHGTAGTYAMLLHGWSRVNKNPAILDALDNYATKLSGFGSRFKPGEFKEAMTLLDRTGFEHVAGEYANISKAYMPTTNFVQNDINKGLRLGQTPFRLGEQSTRVTAWYTAYREFREANPSKSIGNLELQKILNKADLLTVNMSRASSSKINQGVFSLSTQFLSYQIKLAEMFWSKRIGETVGDRVAARARIVTGFALLYGLPNAVGVTGAPISDNIRSDVIDNGSDWFGVNALAKGYNATTNILSGGQGYIPGENFLSTMINEGFPAWSYAMITHTLPNVGDRFGSQGWSNIKQAMRSDISWTTALGGASVSTMGKFVNDAVDPFWQYSLSWMRGDRSDARFTIHGADLVEPLKQISTYSAGARWWTALQTGKWFSNNEQYETDVSPLQATLLSLTGMSLQEQDDQFLKNQMVKGETDAQKVAMADALKDWRRGILAKENNDDEQGNAYFRNAMARLKAVGYPLEKIQSFMAIGNKGYESAIDRANQNMWQKGDQNKQQQRLDQYKRQMKLDQGNK